MRKLHLLASALTALTPACYTYADATLESVSPGAQVRVGISADATARFSDALGAEQRVLEGHVKAREGGGLLIDVVSATRQVGFQFEQLRQTLRLERPDVTYVELKTFDRGRTTFAVGVASVAVGAIAWKALRGKTGGDTRPPGEGGASDARIVRPWFRIPVRFP